MFHLWYEVIDQLLFTLLSDLVLGDLLVDYEAQSDKFVFYYWLSIFILFLVPVLLLSRKIKNWLWRIIGALWLPHKFISYRFEFCVAFGLANGRWYCLAFAKELFFHSLLSHASTQDVSMHTLDNIRWKNIIFLTILNLFTPQIVLRFWFCVAAEQLSCWLYLLIWGLPFAIDLFHRVSVFLAISG